MPLIKLVTKEEWKRLTPNMQGKVCYLQGGLPGSELSDIISPYPVGSREAREFADGSFQAMLDAQDSEE